MGVHSRSASLLRMLAVALGVVLLASGARASGRALQGDLLAPAPEAAAAAPAPAPQAGPEVAVGKGAGLYSQSTSFYIGQVLTFAMSTCPQGMEPMAGQLLSVASNTALFAVIGTTYGGDGKTNFALPNMNGRFPVGTGLNRDGDFFQLGVAGGTSRDPLLPDQLPPISLTLQTAFVAGQPVPAATSKDRFPVFVPYQQGDVPVGQAPTPLPLIPRAQRPLTGLPMYQPLRYCIVVDGMFPTSA